MFISSNSFRSNFLSINTSLSFFLKITTIKKINYIKFRNNNFVKKTGFSLSIKFFLIFLLLILKVFRFLKRFLITENQISYEKL